MTVAHKNLTGTDLHIIKGADTATVGKVPVANGSGDAPFALLTHTSLQTTGNPFGAQLLHVREEQSTGVGTSTASAATFNVQVLNTVKTNEISGASLASNTITLPAGTYFIHARAVNYTASVGSASYGKVKARLRNTTAGTTLIEGTTIGFQNGGASAIYIPMPPSEVLGRFTLAGATDIQLQAYPVSGGAPAAHGGGGVEVYAEVLIWKIA